MQPSTSGAGRVRKFSAKAQTGSDPETVARAAALAVSGATLADLEGAVLGASVMVRLPDGTGSVGMKRADGRWQFSRPRTAVLDNEDVAALPVVNAWGIGSDTGR